MPRKYIRKTGEAARALSLRDRRRLHKFRAYHAANRGLSQLSVDALKTMMAAPFDRKTMIRVIDGKTVRANNCRFVEEFLDKHVPQPVLPVRHDGKSLASGERDEENGSSVAEFMRRGRDAQAAVDEAIRRGSR